MKGQAVFYKPPERSWTPYREAQRYRRLLTLSMLLNVILAGALLHFLR